MRHGECQRQAAPRPEQSVQWYARARESEERTEHDVASAKRQRSTYTTHSGMFIQLAESWHCDTGTHAGSGIFSLLSHFAAARAAC